MAWALALPVPQPAAAQSLPDTAGVATILAKAQASRWHIRLESGRGIVGEGRVERLVHDSVRIQGALIPIAGLASISRRVGDTRSTVRGAMVGGALGLAIGAGLVGLCSYGSEGNCGEGGTLVIGGTFVGSLIGAAVGGIASTGRHVWKEVWSSR